MINNDEWPDDELPDDEWPDDEWPDDDNDDDGKPWLLINGGWYKRLIVVNNGGWLMAKKGWLMVKKG